MCVVCVVCVVCVCAWCVVCVCGVCMGVCGACVCVRVCVCVCSTTDLYSREVEEAILQDGVLAVPEGYGGTQDLTLVNDPKRAVLARHVCMLGGILIRHMLPEATELK